MVDYKATNAVNPPAVGETKLCGRIGETFDRFIYERITGSFAKNNIYKEAEDAFITREDDKNPPIGLWRGEFWGKQIISACRVCRYKKDEELKNFIKQSVYKIMSTADDDGYIGTYKNPFQVFPADREKGREIMGFSCEWNWNIWCRKYTLWGLLECYKLLCDPKILDCAKKFTDQLISVLKTVDANICETGTFYGVASASILKPLLMLYRHTGTKRYFDLAMSIAAGFEDESTNCAKLIRKSLDNIPIHLWNIDLESKKGTITGVTGKVYETLSCFDGILELYRVTGDKKFLKAAENFFDLLIEYEYNTLKSVGFNDVFIFAGSAHHCITEPCDVIHFMRFLSELYKLTKEPKYIDYFETAFLNPFLASVQRDGKWGARGVRTSGRHLYAQGQSGMKHNHCCVNNIPRGFINAAECIAVSNHDGVFINLYFESETTVMVNCSTVNIKISDGYQQYGRVTVEIKTNKHGPLAINLRIPKWSGEITIDDGSSKLTVKDIGYHTMFINSSAVFNLQFNIEPRLLKHGYSEDFYPLTPYMKMRYLSGEDDFINETLNERGGYVCMAGPTILALCSDNGYTADELYCQKTRGNSALNCTAVPKPSEGFGCGFEVQLSDGKETTTLFMNDFASASDHDTKYGFTVFI